MNAIFMLKFRGPDRCWLEIDERRNFGKRRDSFDSILGMSLGIHRSQYGDMSVFYRQEFRHRFLNSGKCNVLFNLSTGEILKINFGFVDWYKKVKSEQNQ